LKEGKKRVSFELRVMITEELIRLILSYGSSVEILEPASLRDEIKKRVGIMSEMYSAE
jgi:predicted DNA-binding transcriptional regulator YafY